MKKTMFMTMVSLAATAFLLMAQDVSKFNGTWKAESGQTRKLTVKDGVIYMEELNAGRPDPILRQYPANGTEITMPDNYGVWAGATAKGKMEGNKLVVDTVSKSFGNWHDEWTMAPDGKSYEALRVSTGGNFANKGGGKGPGGGAPPAGDGAAKAPAAGGGGGGGKGKAAPTPETFHKVE